MAAANPAYQEALEVFVLEAARSSWSDRFIMLQACRRTWDPSKGKLYRYCGRASKFDRISAERRSRVEGRCLRRWAQRLHCAMTCRQPEVQPVVPDVRDLELFALLARGCTHTQAALALGLKQSTVSMRLACYRRLLETDR